MAAAQGPSEDRPGEEGNGGLAEQKLTPYQRYIWSVANDRARFADERLRSAFRARITVSFFSAQEIAAVITESGDVPEGLGAEEYTRLVALKSQRLVATAEVVIDSLRDQENLALAIYELEHRRKALQMDILREQELVEAFQDFGRFCFVQACQEVARFLDGNNPVLRAAAFETLVITWGLPEYRESVWRFLSDRDTGCKRVAVQALSAQKKGSHDRGALVALAQVVGDPQEEGSLRLEAYFAMKEIAQGALDESERREMELQLEALGTMAAVAGIDWELVGTYST